MKRNIGHTKNTEARYDLKVSLIRLLVETRKSRDDLRDPPNDLRRLDRDPNSTQRRQFNHNSKRVGTNLHPVAVDSQVESVFVSDLAPLAVTVKGPYPTLALALVDEVLKWV